MARGASDSKLPRVFSIDFYFISDIDCIWKELCIAFTGL